MNDLAEDLARAAVAAIADAPRPLTEEERARIQAARNRGEICALCGRALAAGESVWLEKAGVSRSYSGRTVRWWVPVGRECASPEVLRESDGPAPCAGCGRGVLGRAPSRSRTLVVCSKRCRLLAARVRAKEATG